MDDPVTPAAPPRAYLMDMDGVLVRGAQLIPGADGFIERLRAQGLPFLVLTNNSLYTPRDLQLRLERIGLRVRAEEIFTSALATAQFLHDQLPNGTAYVIGEAGLTTALARGRLCADRCASRLCGARRDHLLQLSAPDGGDPARGGGRAFHRHQPRCQWTQRAGARSRHRRCRSAHRRRHWSAALLSSASPIR